MGAFDRQDASKLPPFGVGCQRRRLRVLIKDESTPHEWCRPTTRRLQIHRHEYRSISCLFCTANGSLPRLTIGHGSHAPEGEQAGRRKPDSENAHRGRSGGVTAKSLVEAPFSSCIKAWQPNPHFRKARRPRSFFAETMPNIASAAPCLKPKSTSKAIASVP